MCLSTCERELTHRVLLEEAIDTNNLQMNMASISKLLLIDPCVT